MIATQSVFHLYSVLFSICILRFLPVLFLYSIVLFYCFYSVPFCIPDDRSLRVPRCLKQA